MHVSKVLTLVILLTVLDRSSGGNVDTTEPLHENSVYLMFNSGSVGSGVSFIGAIRGYRDQAFYIDNDRHIQVATDTGCISWGSCLAAILATMNVHHTYVDKVLRNPEIMYGPHNPYAKNAPTKSKESAAAAAPPPKPDADKPKSISESISSMIASSYTSLGQLEFVPDTVADDSRVMRFSKYAKSKVKKLMHHVQFWKKSDTKPLDNQVAADSTINHRNLSDRAQFDKFLTTQLFEPLVINHHNLEHVTFYDLERLTDCRLHIYTTTTIHMCEEDPVDLRNAVIINNTSTRYCYFTPKIQIFDSERTPHIRVADVMFQLYNTHVTMMPNLRQELVDWQQKHTKKVLIFTPITPTTHHLFPDEVPCTTSTTSSSSSTIKRKNIENGSDNDLVVEIPNNSNIEYQTFEECAMERRLSSNVKTSMHRLFIEKYYEDETRASNRIPITDYDTTNLFDRSTLCAKKQPKKLAAAIKHIPLETMILRDTIPDSKQIYYATRHAYTRAKYFFYTFIEFVRLWEK